MKIPYFALGIFALGTFDLIFGAFLFLKNDIHMVVLGGMLFLFGLVLCMIGIVEEK